MSDGLQGISKANETAGTVLGLAAWLLMQDPQIVAMAEHNDRDRFIEGCRADPAFRSKLTRALVKIRAAAVAA